MSKTISMDIILFVASSSVSPHSSEEFLEPDPGQEFRLVNTKQHSRAKPFVDSWINYSFHPCEYEKAEGVRCSAFSTRKYWYYDKMVDKCALFIFRGCDGNANRFKYKNVCEMCLKCRQERRYQDCNKSKI